MPEGVFDKMAVAVSGLVVNDFALSVSAPRDDGDLALLAQALSDHVGII